MRISKKTWAAIKRERRKWGENLDVIPYIRGLSHQPMARLRGLKGAKLGPASAGRTLSDEERKAIEAQMRAEGKL